MTKIELDSFDRALLEHMQQHNLTPARELAERVGLSESAVLRRIRQLRKSGVIAKDISVVNHARLGLSLTIIVLVQFVRDDRAHIEKFANTLHKRKEVVNAWYVAGETDFVLVLRLGDMADYERFRHDVLAGARKFTTLVSMREYVPGN
jgi:DNA-binding Lrp family transcriptional regulator